MIDWAEVAYEVFENCEDSDLCKDEARELFRQNDIPDDVAEAVLADIFGE